MVITNWPTAKAGERLFGWPGTCRATTWSSTPPADDFGPDTNLPPGWYQVQSYSYSGSGFDRAITAPFGRPHIHGARQFLHLPDDEYDSAGACVLTRVPGQGLESFIRGTSGGRQ